MLSIWLQKSKRFIPLCTELPRAACASSGVLNAIRIMRMRPLGGRGSEAWTWASAFREEADSNALAPPILPERRLRDPPKPAPPWYVVIL